MFNTFRTAFLAVALLIVAGASAQARSYVVSYEAFIGPADLYNSKGVRLRSAAAIIQQDRANVHRFGVIDFGDSIDPFFTTVARRQALSRRLQGQISGPVARAIRRGGVTLLVHAQVSNGRVVDVWFERIG